MQSNNEAIDYLHKLLGASLDIMQYYSGVKDISITIIFFSEVDVIHKYSLEDYL